MKQTNAFGKAFSSIELASFCGQVALILKSGISALEGLNIMLEDTFSPEEEPILKALIENMQETGSLYLALEETKLFPSYMIHMGQISVETPTPGAAAPFPAGRSHDADLMPTYCSE